jgi:hypothetical protein
MAVPHPGVRFLLAVRKEVGSWATIGILDGRKTFRFADFLLYYIMRQ